MKYLIIFTVLFYLYSFAHLESEFPKQVDAKIEKLYKKKCSKCHGIKGEGIKNKKKKPPINHLGKIDDQTLFDIIRDGYKGKIGRMPKLSKKFASDKDVKDLVKHVKSFDTK